MIAICERSSIETAVENANYAEIRLFSIIDMTKFHRNICLLTAVTIAVMKTHRQITCTKQLRNTCGSEYSISLVVWEHAVR